MFYLSSLIQNENASLIKDEQQMFKIRQIDTSKLEISASF